MKGLIGQTAIYTVANIASRGTAVVALMVFPFFLGAADYGALGLIMTIAALVQLLVPLEVSQGLARYYGTAAEAEKPAYAASAWWFTVVTLVITAVAALLMSDPIAQVVFGGARYANVFRLAVPLFVCFTLFYFLQSMCRWKFMTVAYVWLSLAFSGLTLALGLALAVSRPDALEGLVLGQMLGMAATVAAGTVVLRRDLFRRFDTAKLRPMLRFSLPLVPASLALFASFYASRLILSAVADLASVGIFVFASQIAAIAGLTIIGVQSSLTPYVMSHYQEPETPAVLARLFEGFTVLAILLCLAMGLFAPPLIATFAPPTYAAAGPLVIVLCPPAIMLQMYIFWPGFAIAERTDWQLWVSVIAGTMAVVANAVLIPWLGLTGAAAASVASAFVFLALWIFLANLLYPVPVRWTRVWLVVGVYVVAGIAGSALITTGTSAIAWRCGLFAAAALTVLVLGPVRAIPALGKLGSKTGN